MATLLFTVKKTIMLPAIFFFLSWANCLLQAEEKSPSIPSHLFDVNEIANPYNIVFRAQKFEDVSIENVGNVAAYQFIVRKAPLEMQFVLFCQSLGKPPTPVFEYEADDHGELGRQLGPGTMMLDNDLVLLFNFFQGEPVDYWLVSKDLKTVMKTSFVPYPIKAEGKDEASISIKRLVPDARLLLCEGDGFLPDERLLITTRSGDRCIPNIAINCVNGRFALLLEPEVAGKSGGTASLEVRRFHERLFLDYDWGSEALNKRKMIADANRMAADTLQQLSLDSEIK